MAWISWELGLLFSAVLLQAAYRLVYDRLAAGSGAHTPGYEELRGLQHRQQQAGSGDNDVGGLPSRAGAGREARGVADEAEVEARVAEQARKDAAEKLASAVFEGGGAVRDGGDDHLRGFPEDPQASFRQWGTAYERHLACAGNTSWKGMWVARVRRYGVDPLGGDSWGVSITGAQLMAVGRDVFVHGGWDDQTAARDAVFSANVGDIVRTGKFEPSRVLEGFVAGVAPASCPGPAYGHTVTHLGGQEYLMAGGVRLGGYRGLLDHWGTFQLSRAAKGGLWQLKWTRCGRDDKAARAWHTATLVPEEVAADGRAYVLLCGGSGASAPAAGFEPATGSFRALPGMDRACRRAGHSAVRVGSEVLVMGGTDHLGAGMPWRGEDLRDIEVLDAVDRGWKPGVVTEDQLAALPEGLLARQHSAVEVEQGSVLVLAGGLGGLGGGRAMLLNFTSLRTGDAQRPWARALAGLPLPTRCKEEEEEAVVPSALVPPLRGHAAAWTGSEVVVFGGAVLEREGYHGMLLLRPL